MKKLLILVLCLLCCACDNKKETVSQFKSEYEKYNEEYLALELEDSDLIRYSKVSEINSLIKKGTGVIFFGSPTDNLSRRVIDILLEVADNTGLKEIYYMDTLDGIEGLDSIEGKKLPLVLFVLEGKIVGYRVGTVDDKVDLTDDDIVTLYNQYSEGIHQVLQDACDEAC